MDNMAKWKKALQALLVCPFEWVLSPVLGFLLARVMVPFAYHSRGYVGLGGEGLLIVAVLGISFWSMHAVRVHFR